MAEWTEETANGVLAERGYIVNTGQIPASLKRRLDRRVAKGELVKWRGHWNAPLGGFGCGPLKTIYGRLDLAPQQGN